MMCLSLLSQLIVVVSTVLYIVAPVSPRNSKRLLRTIFLTVLLAGEQSQLLALTFYARDAQRNCQVVNTFCEGEVDRHLSCLRGCLDGMHKWLSFFLLDNATGVHKKQHLNEQSTCC